MQKLTFTVHHTWHFVMEESSGTVVGVGGWDEVDLNGKGRN